MLALRIHSLLLVIVALRSARLRVTGMRPGKKKQRPRSGRYQYPAEPATRLSNLFFIACGPVCFIVHVSPQIGRAVLAGSRAAFHHTGTISFAQGPLHWTRAAATNTKSTPQPSWRWALLCSQERTGAQQLVRNSATPATPRRARFCVCRRRIDSVAFCIRVGYCALLLRSCVSSTTAFWE